MKRRISCFFSISYEKSFLKTVQIRFIRVLSNRQKYKFKNYPPNHFSLKISNLILINRLQTATNEIKHLLSDYIVGMR